MRFSFVVFLFAIISLAVGADRLLKVIAARRAAMAPRVVLGARRFWLVSAVVPLSPAEV